MFTQCSSMMFKPLSEEQKIGFLVIFSHLTYQLFLCRQKDKDCCMGLLFEFFCVSSLYTAHSFVRHRSPLPVQIKSEQKLPEMVFFSARKHFQHLLLCS